MKKTLAIAAMASLIAATAAGTEERLLLAPARVTADTPASGYASSRLQWNGAQLGNPAARTLRLQVSPPTRFTSLAVGWTVKGGSPPPGEFSFVVTSRTRDGAWCPRVTVRGETAPDESPSGLYWSSLYMTPGGMSNDEVEIQITAPPSVLLASLQILAAEILPLASPAALIAPPHAAKGTGYPRPTIIPRSAWWGNLPPDSLDGHFGPILITITHAVVHHTAMTNNPPDPSQEIRSIWWLHVYGNGWSDIGYNFLIDQFGNIYQGRYNPWLDSTDIQGAHATSANAKSVGVSVLGNFSAAGGGIPDPRALRSLENLIAWRFDQRGLDPLESASIPTNLGGPRVVPRICGHRDVGTTECPGESLYVLLPETRLNVQSLLYGTAVRGGGDVVDGYSLLQNFPNPFNPSTTISYELPRRSRVTLTLYTIIGQPVARLVEGEREAGYHEVEFDGSGLASGTYYYRLEAVGPSKGGTAGYIRTRKMLLLR